MRPVHRSPPVNRPYEGRTDIAGWRSPPPGALPDAVKAAEQHKRRGVLFASGLIVGESIIGVIIAAIIVASVTSGGSGDHLALVGKEFASTAKTLGVVIWLLVVVYFVRRVIADRK